MEASGTSGMKAALNAVPHFSSRAGWWIEGIEMDQNAEWVFGPETDGISCPADDPSEVNEIYEILEREIIPMYYERRNEWIERMKCAVKLISFFNTHRMVREYAQQAWQLETQPRWRSVKYKWMDSIK